MSLTRKPNGGQRQNSPQGDLDDVNDWTSPIDFAFNSTTLLVVTVESIISSLIRLTAFLALRLAGVAIYLFVYPVTLLVGAAVIMLRLVFTGKLNIKDQYSAVNFGAITELRKYKAQPHLKSLLVAPKAKPADNSPLSERLGNLELAHFFCMLSSAVYESNWFHDELLTKWFESWAITALNWRRFLNTNSCSCTIIHKEIDSKLVIMVIFKGTSPFNLNEWMSDCSVQKVTDRDFLSQYQYPLGGGYPPGTIHEGFYNSFTRNPAKGCEPPLEQILREVADLMEGRNPDDVRLWVAGHSLGAALATCFTTFILAKARDVHDKATLPVWGRMLKALTGVYTFGNPRIADRTYGKLAEEALVAQNIPLRRFRNANDIVPTIPFGTGLLSEIWQHVTQTLGEVPQLDGSSISDWDEIGLGFRIRQTGQAMLFDKLIAPLTPDDLKKPFLRFLVARVSLRVRKYTIDLFETIANLMLSMWKVIQAFVVAVFSLSWLVWDMLAAANNGSSALLPVVNIVSQFVNFATMLVMPSFIYDHIPTEYASNIDAYMKSMQSSWGEEKKSK